MRDAMRRHIPSAIADGLKQGFSAPDASWFRGESIDYVRAVLDDRRARIYDYLDYTATRRLVSDPALAAATGRFYDRTREARAAAQAYDPAARAELWRRSLELTSHPGTG